MRNKSWVNEGRQRNHPDATIQCVTMWEKQETDPGRAGSQEEEHLFQGKTRIKCHEEANMQSGLQTCSGLSRSRDEEVQGGPWQDDKVDKTRSASATGLDGLTYRGYKICPMALKLLWNLMTVRRKKDSHKTKQFRGTALGKGYLLSDDEINDQLSPMMLFSST